MIFLSVFIFCCDFVNSAKFGINCETARREETEFLTYLLESNAELPLRRNEYRGCEESCQGCKHSLKLIADYSELR